MKNLVLLSLLFLIFSCSSDDSTSNTTDPDPDPDPDPVTNYITSFSVAQEGGTVVFNYTSSSDCHRYEVAYALSSSTADPNDLPRTGTLNLDSFSETFEFMGFNIGDTCKFWVRGVYDDGTNYNTPTAWFGPETLQLVEYCPNVTNIYFQQNGTLTWDNTNSDITPTYYQIQYGPYDFQLGQGTIVESTQTYSVDLILHQNEPMHAYVRAYCPNNGGFGAWQGPAHYNGYRSLNVCAEPSNVGVSYSYFHNVPVVFTFHWDDDGNNRTYECNMVNNNEPPDANPIESVTNYQKFIKYNTFNPNGYFDGLSGSGNNDFYVRTVCLDGSRTEWVGPLDVL